MSRPRPDTDAPEPYRHRQVAVSVSLAQRRDLDSFRDRLSDALGYRMSLPQAAQILLRIAQHTEPQHMPKHEPPTERLRQLLLRLPEHSHQELATLRDRLSDALGTELTTSHTVGLLIRLGATLRDPAAILGALRDAAAEDTTPATAPTRKTRSNPS